MFLYWMIGLALWAVFLVFTTSVAASKGHSPLLWGLAACFLPFISFIIVLLLPNKKGYAVR